MAEHVHEWQLTFKPDSFRRVRCKHCPEQMLDYDIERRLNATERLSAEDARETEKEIRGASPASDLFPRWKRRSDALKAYADTLEGK